MSKEDEIIASIKEIKREISIQKVVNDASFSTILKGLNDLLHPDFAETGLKSVHEVFSRAEFRDAPYADEILARLEKRFILKK